VREEHSMDPEARDKLHQIMAQSASVTGATVHAYPRPGRAVRRGHPQGHP